MAVVLPSQQPVQCTLCPLCQTRRTIVPSYLPEGARVLFLGQAPGPTEDAEGVQPFTGVSGRLLTEALYEVGLNRQSVALANVVRCYPGKTAEDPTEQEIVTCTPFLEQELTLLHPDLVVPLGNIPLGLFGKTGITRCRGKLFFDKSRQLYVLPIYHPAHVTRNLSLRQTFVDDLSKVVEFLEGRLQVTPPAPVTYRVVRTLGDFIRLIQQLDQAPLWTFDLETVSWDFLSDPILCISFSWRVQLGVVLPLHESKGEGTVTSYWGPDEPYVFEELRRVFSNGATKVAHNCTFDAKFLLAKGIVPTHLEDTLLMHHLLEEEAPHDLKTLALDLTDMGEYDEEVWELRHAIAKQRKVGFREVTFDLIPTKVLYRYTAADADATFRVYSVLRERLEEQQLWSFFQTLVVPLREMLTAMEYRGVTIDIPYLDATIADYQRRMAQQFSLLTQDPVVVEYVTQKNEIIAQEASQHYETSPTLQRQKTWEAYWEGVPKFAFNPRSHNQLVELFVGQLHLPIVQRTDKGNPSIDGEVLKEYAKVNPFAKILADYNNLAHTLSTFLIGMRKSVRTDGRIRTEYQPTEVTGRIRSSNPNLQNIPRDDTIVQNIFTASPGYWLVEVDSRQIEFRLLGHYANDEKMIADVASGMDIHRYIASVFFGVSIDQVTDVQRKEIKFVVYGILYGRGAKSIAEEHGLPLREADGIIKGFFSLYPKSSDWLRYIVRMTRRQKWVRTTLGRVRHLPGIDSGEDWQRADAERQAQNFPLQGLATDIVNGVFAVTVWRKFQERGMASHPIMTIHDGVFFDVPEGELPVAVPLIREVFTSKVPGIRIPLDAELKIGERWGTLVPLTEEDFALLSPGQRPREGKG